MTQQVLLTLFGATGDLAARKLYPAIYQLYLQGAIHPEFALIGTARREWSDDYFRQVVKDSIGNLAISQEHLDYFTSHFYYQAHDVNDSHHYRKLKQLAENLEEKYQLNGNRIFYFSVAPEFFPIISSHLKSEHLLSPRGFNRLIIEKPFGHDLASANQLQDQLTSTFDEDQIYRIDHYLGKEMVQAIQSIKSSNSLLANQWNKEAIANIQISLLETVGVEERAGYYDQSGVTKDMIQNHALQLLALIALTPQIKSSDIPQAKERILSHIRLEDPNNFKQHTIRAQYGPSNDGLKQAYRKEQGVPIDSLTETYFAARIELDLPEWQGVPFYIRSGKHLNQKATTISVEFKSPHKKVPANVLIFEIGPQLSIKLRLNTKANGYHHHLAEMELTHSYNTDQKIPDDYERLIYECLKGNRTHFAHWQEVKEAWRYIDYIHDMWQKEITDYLIPYPTWSSGPKQADQLLKADGFYWHT